MKKRASNFWWPFGVLWFVWVMGSVSLLNAKIPPKTPSDVYAYAMVLKQEVDYLRQKEGIHSPFPTVQVERNKRPRHVIQKALEILNKIDRYRRIKGYGPIAIPPYPPHEITPQDVYEVVKRLDGEVRVFIDDPQFLQTLHKQHYHAKVPSDVYELLWSISLGFDDLLGGKGYTPSDVYALSQKVVKIVSFLRHSQNIFDRPPKSKKEPEQHSNHALYAAIDLTKKIAESQRRLWIDPADVPAKPHRTVVPVEVYDMLQYDIAELQRIKYRLGIERYFKIDPPKEERTSSDVVQNLRYALRLLPSFSFQHPLVQYPLGSLEKTPNHVYGVTEEILHKFQRLRTMRGIYALPEDPPKIHGLLPIHAYQKGIEAIEKAIRLKVRFGMHPSEVPTSPFRPITPSQVYELMIRLDGIATILLQTLGDQEVIPFIYQKEHPIYSGKTPSDVYFNLWKISRLIDLISNTQYTPNETYLLAKKIFLKTHYLPEHFGIKDRVKIDALKVIEQKQPKDVYNLLRRLNRLIALVQRRANMQVHTVTLPRSSKVTPNTVYNGLRIINASINELFINLGIDAEDIERYGTQVQNKTPSDVYALVALTIRRLQQLFKDNAYVTP